MVDHSYEIGRFEVTAAQWASVIAADPNVGNAGLLTTDLQSTTAASWYEAAKFCNWLTTGNAYSGAYQFDGFGVLTAVDRTVADGSCIALVINAPTATPRGICRSARTADSRTETSG